jgi:hypothetical protein
VYWKALPLRPNRYRIDLVVKDVNGDRAGTWNHAIQVPEFTEDKLAHSTLIVADKMEKVPVKAVGTGNFVIGNTYVRPRVESADGKPAAFKKSQNQKANFWMQVYNLAIDEQTKKPNAQIHYEVVNTADPNKPVIQLDESTDKMGNVGDQLTLEKSLSLDRLPLGLYQLKITVKDNVSKQTITPTARFAVEQ